MGVEHACPMDVAYVGGAGRVLILAMLMEELTITEL